MPLLDRAAQTNQFAGLLAQRRRPDGLSAPQMPTPAPAPSMQPMQAMQAISPMTPGNRAGEDARRARERADAQRPPPPGILGVEQEAREAEGDDVSPGVLGTIRSIFAGSRDPRLTKEENKSAIAQGLGIAGMAGLALATGGASIPVSILGGAGIGRAVSQGRRGEAFEAATMRAAMLAEQEKNNAIRDIYTRYDIFDPEQRADAAREFGELGLLEEHDRLMDRHLKLEDLDINIREADREDAVHLQEQQDRIQADLIFDSIAGQMDDPDALRTAAARLTQFGKVDAAAELNRTAENILKDGDVTWQDHGGYRGAHLRDGTEVFRVHKTLSPMEQANLMNQNMQQRFSNTQSLRQEFEQTINARGTAVVSQAASGNMRIFDDAQQAGRLINTSEAQVLITNLMAMTADGATTRDQTTQRLLQSGGLRGWTEERLNYYLNGGAPDSGVMQELLQATITLSQGHQDQIAPTLQNFRDRAQEMGVDPRHIEDPFWHVSEYERRKKLREEMSQAEVDAFLRGGGNPHNPFRR